MRKFCLLYFPTFIIQRQFEWKITIKLHWIKEFYIQSCLKPSDRAYLVIISELRILWIKENEFVIVEVFYSLNFVTIWDNFLTVRLNSGTFIIDFLTYDVATFRDIVQRCPTTRIAIGLLRNSFTVIFILVFDLDSNVRW